MPDSTETSIPNLAYVAKALADERRAQLAMALLDGRAWTPTELALKTDSTADNINDTAAAPMAPGLARATHNSCAEQHLQANRTGGPATWNPASSYERQERLRAIQASLRKLLIRQCALWHIAHQTPLAIDRTLHQPRGTKMERPEQAATPRRSEQMPVRAPQNSLTDDRHPQPIPSDVDRRKLALRI